MAGSSKGEVSGRPKRPRSRRGAQNGDVGEKRSTKLVPGKTGPADADPGVGDAEGAQGNASAWGAGDVRVRMYRDILGDCFLLAFPGGTRDTHVLIDSGMLLGTEGAQQRARRIMRDIASATGGRIDVLVATHEHFDHLSCFSMAGDVFMDIEVGELWLAWTEDPRNEMAQELRNRRRHALQLLDRSHDALARLHVDEEVADDDEPGPIRTGPGWSRLDGLRHLLAFHGRDPGTGAPPRRGEGTGEILDLLRGKAGKVRYLRPGRGVVRHDALPGISIYVLGPPEDASSLRRSRPSRKDGEVYKLGPFPEAGDLPLATPLPGELSDRGDAREQPFDAKHMVYHDFEARSSKSLDETAVADAPATAPLSTYEQADLNWRKIDLDWFGAAEQLALKLDSDTNNTSLVLAFELGDAPGAKVLLFPGDAQVGSWLSWADHAWSHPGREAPVTAADLLARTVLYKVSHHGSHNATLRDRGLELMTDDALVAMVPVDEVFATTKKHWSMPFPALFRRLMERTGGRVLRADEDLADLRARVEGLTGPERLSELEWRSFLAAVREIYDLEGVVAWEHRVAMAR